MRFLCLTAVLIYGGLIHADAASDAEQKAVAVYASFNAGQVPALTDSSTKYYSGSCTILNPSYDPTANYYVLVAIKKDGEQVLTTWSITYYETDNPYLAESKEQLAAEYSPRLPAKVEGNHLHTDVGTEFKLFYEISADPKDPNLLYVVGKHLGLTYCQARSI